MNTLQYTNSQKINKATGSINDFDDVQISESGMFLIHNVWGVAVGGAEDFRKIADDFDKHNDIIVDVYRKKTGKPKTKKNKVIHESYFAKSTVWFYSN